MHHCRSFNIHMAPYLSEVDNQIRDIKKWPQTAIENETEKTNQPKYKITPTLN